MAPGVSTPEKTAPGALELVQRFVNSVDLESGEDELAGPEELRGWLAERDGLRALLMANNGMPLDEERVARLDRAAARAGVRVVFTAGSEPRLAPESGGVDGAIARLLAIVAGAVEQGRWARLKACPRDVCHWAFFDHSKNHSGRWCLMEVCGNIEKARKFRERNRGARH
jgi:predicted RNA-binding Zn ribbon-like protein